MVYKVREKNTLMINKLKNNLLWIVLGLTLVGGVHHLKMQKRLDRMQKIEKMQMRRGGKVAWETRSRDRGQDRDRGQLEKLREKRGKKK